MDMEMEKELVQRRVEHFYGRGNESRAGGTSETGSLHAEKSSEDDAARASEHLHHLPTSGLD
jgi:hypothetical protein